MAWTPGKYCMTAQYGDPFNITLKGKAVGDKWENIRPYNTDELVKRWSAEVFEIKRETVEKADCYPPRREFGYWMAWVTSSTTWLYISTQDVWIVFLLYVCFSRFGKIKLGPDDEPPDFTNIEWFAMIFCCGVATGLFYFSVGEPINHYEPCGKWAWSGPKVTGGKPDFGDIPCIGSNWANRFSHLPDNERAQEAINLTLYHWGLHGWVCYAIVGCLLALLHFRKGLPLTMKTCFYPLIGTRIYHFWGDVIDVVSIVCTTFGVCTSLGMGVQQMNAGIRRLNGGYSWLSNYGGFYGQENQAEWWDNGKSAFASNLKSIYDVQKESWRLKNEWGFDSARTIADRGTQVSEQILLIWIITSVSTLSICTGLDIGVKWLSIIALVLGSFLLWVVFAMDDTWFILNLFVQSIGQYINFLPKIGFYTGAFDQPEHAAPDGRQEYGPPTGAGWMNDWTIFYWGWWISWAPFCGVFLARISKGRTIREFILTCLIITVTYNFIWMVVWGGAALKMEMAAEKAGIDCSDGYSKNYCRVDSTPTVAGRTSPVEEQVFFCSTVTRLSCHYFDYPPMMFDVVGQYASLGTFLSVVILVALFLYFITSSDSGSLVDTIVAANGIEEPCIVQRVWWSLTEGLAATGLMYSSIWDVEDARGTMKALQAASIAAGLPYTVLVCLMCVALWKALQYELEEAIPKVGFRSSVIDIGVTLYEGVPGRNRMLNFGAPKFVPAKFLRVLKNIFCPAIDMFEALRKCATMKKGRSGPWEVFIAVFVGGVLYYTGWLLIAMDSIPIAEGGYITLGVQNGTYNIMETKISNRYGHFREHTNEWKEGEVVINPTNFYPDHKESMGVGPRLFPSLYLAVFGWFFILFFCSMVMVLRSNVRQVLKIAGNQIDDCLLSFFFFPTVLVQVNEVLDDGALEPEVKAEAVAVDAKADNAVEVAGISSRVEALEKDGATINKSIEGLTSTIGRMEARFGQLEVQKQSHTEVSL
eukprot:TRINITY_DN2718_c0_g1_i1.p1 TRINITY_DN2718_c0_g1~~TRINITY_DN2718_c0_g1_i1.p1  ORF type:complete len:1083 (+),score=158.12 TRINITY_DN2718_c0_g1_i1:304-3249(+)